eukprot:scaffold45216_cov22-Tisochrysis_lutea.AAC.1
MRLSQPKHARLMLASQTSPSRVMGPVVEPVQENHAGMSTLKLASKLRDFVMLKYQSNGRPDSQIIDAPRSAGCACVTAFECAFQQALDALAAEHGNAQRSQELLNCIVLCQIRYGSWVSRLRNAVPGHAVVGLCMPPIRCEQEDCLKRAGFGDIFRKVKQEENAAALAVLPGVLKNLDECSDTSERDGAAASFVNTRTKLLPRPWVIDDLDASVQRLTS